VGERIPLLARIVFCCDAFEAMTAERSHDSARTPEEAAADLRHGAETRFDPAVVEAFLEVLAARDEHPVSHAESAVGPVPPAH
jgi:HD-GYP domain-containing protein (c-di-GMP phosphodiesterase class II)